MRDTESPESEKGTLEIPISNRETLILRETETPKKLKDTDTAMRNTDSIVSQSPIL